MSRQYDFTLASALGSTAKVGAMGSVLRMISTPGGPVRVTTDTGLVCDLEAGQGFRMPAGTKFSEVYIRNITAVGQTGLVFIGDETFEDTRIPGQVAIIDGSVNPVAADQEFLASASCGGVPAAGQFGQMQIWNGSTTSGVVLRSIVCQFSTLAMSLRFRLSNQEMTGATAVQLGSKRTRSVGGGLGSGVAIGIRYRNTGVSGAGNDVNGLVGGMNFPMYVPAGGEQTEVLGLTNAPILLAPGTGLVVAAETAVSDFQLMVSAQIRPWVWG